MKPYRAVDVSDKIPSPSLLPSESRKGIPDEIGGGREGKLEIWGLTGWYVHRLGQVLEIWD